MSETQEFPAVGIIGLGAMGGPMSRNMLAKGVPLSVLDLDQEKLSEAKAAGATVVSSPGDLGRTCAATLIVVQTDDEVLDVGGAVAAAAEPGHVIVICSSVKPETCRRMAEVAGEHGVKVVDVPLTGGIRSAVAGTLNLLVGGDDEDVARVRPVLDTMAAGVHHLGPLGSGQVGKTVNNLIHWAEIAAIVEGFKLAESLGVSVPQLRAALQEGPTDGKTMRQMEDFRLTWWKKDLDNAFDMAPEGQDLRLSHEVFDMMPGITVQTIAELLQTPATGTGAAS